MKTIRFKGPSGVDVPLLFDCPWMGHEADERIVVRNSSAPNVIGRRCVKCGCLIYNIVETASEVIGADGTPLAGA